MRQRPLGKEEKLIREGAWRMAAALEITRGSLLPSPKQVGRSCHAAVRPLSHTWEDPNGGAILFVSFGLSAAL